MKKKLASFLSGIGTGLCLAVVILTLWAMIWPDKGGFEANDLAPVQSFTEVNSQSEPPTEPLPDSPPPSADVNGVVTPSLPQDSKEVEIKMGMSAKQISDLLLQEGIIDDAQEFHNYSIEHGKTRRFMVGVFSLSAGMSYEELLGLLTIPS